MTLTPKQLEAVTDGGIRYAIQAIMDNRPWDAERILRDIEAQRLEARHEKVMALQSK